MDELSLLGVMNGRDLPDVDNDPNQIPVFHADLARLYRQHGPRIQQKWRSLDKEHRSRLVLRLFYPVLLEHSKDPRDEQGNVLWPEFNHRDIAMGSHDYFLNFLKHRATTSLAEQYLSGPDGAYGDCLFVLKQIPKRNRPRLMGTPSPWISFEDEAEYGQPCERPTNADELLQYYNRYRTFVVPEPAGKMIMTRQRILLFTLKTIVDDLLEVHGCQCDKMPDLKLDATKAALAQMSLHTPSRQLDLSDLLESSIEQYSIHEDFAYILGNVPAVLVDRVQFSFKTRPEALQDATGRIPAPLSDKYISETVLNVLQDSIQTTSVWSYISRLVKLLIEPSTTLSPTSVLRELSAACNVEYTQARAFLKTHVSTSKEGRRFFKRISTKDGIAQAALRCSPETLTAVDPQHHYLLRLCSNETTWSQATDWLQRLEDLHRAHPLEKDRISGRQVTSLGRLAIIVSFIRDLAGLVSLPAPSKKAKQRFSIELSALEKDLARLKPELDIGEYAIPVVNMMEPGVAEKAIIAIDDYIVEDKGTCLRNLYEDLVENCVAALYEKHEQPSVKPDEVYSTYGYAESGGAAKFAVQERKEKVKTRPEHSFTLEATTQFTLWSASTDESIQPLQTFKVKRSTHAVFSKMFARSSMGRGPVD